MSLRDASIFHARIKRHVITNFRKFRLVGTQFSGSRSTKLFVFQLRIATSVNRFRLTTDRTLYERERIAPTFKVDSTSSTVYWLSRGTLETGWSWMKNARFLASFIRLSSSRVSKGWNAKEEREVKRREKVHPDGASETPEALYADPRRSIVSLRIPFSLPLWPAQRGALSNHPRTIGIDVLYSIAVHPRKTAQPLQMQSIPRVCGNNDAYIRRGWTGCLSGVTLKNARAIHTDGNATRIRVANPRVENRRIRTAESIRGDVFPPRLIRSLRLSLGETEGNARTIESQSEWKIAQVDATPREIAI